jgi:DNA-binding NarL/FixJ family response regulator
MSQLGARDLRMAVDFALEARAIDDLDGFRHQLVPALRRLVPCNTLGYTEIDPTRGIAVSISDAPPLNGLAERFLELADQHPMVAPQRRGDLSAHLISDFLSVRRFHQLELYQDVYCHLGVEDQLAVGLSHESIVAIHLTRERRTFTERDREILELARSHLRLSYTQACDNERIRALLQALDSALEDRHTAVLQLDAQARIQHATAAASELLEAYFDTPPGDRHLLPTKVREWLKHPPRSGSPNQLTVESRRGRLTLREQKLGHLPGWRILILEEQRPGPPSIEALRSLGLTTRQAQILRLLACGKRSRQVAAELGISPATVEKHLEHIYRRLGVSSLQQALARLFASSR